MASVGRTFCPTTSVTTSRSDVGHLNSRKGSLLLQSPVSVSTRLQTAAQFNSSPMQTDKQEEMMKREMEDYVRKNFHKKECSLFVPKPNQNVGINKDLKCHCGEILSKHEWAHSGSTGGDNHVPQEYRQVAERPDEKPPEHLTIIEWTADNIKLSQTNAFGEISFNVDMVGGKKPAKYIRLSDDDDVDACLEMMDKYWKIMDPFPPNLVISVVGGAKNFHLDGEMRDTFSHGLIKAAKATNAWLITSGTNTGVTKAVGQTVQESQPFSWHEGRMVHLIRCIAIGPWGFTLNRECLEEKEGQGHFSAYYQMSYEIAIGKPVSPNPHHTHYILVDDGYRNRYDGVASFRAKFEKKIRTLRTEKGYDIPVVMLVLEGGTDAIHEASVSLKQGIPVVVCSGTGRAADLLTYAHKISQKAAGESGHLRKKLENDVLETFGKNWGDHVQQQENLKRTMDKIDVCIERKSLMIFFDLRRDEDLDVAILSVLIKAEAVSGAKKHLKQLELALTWNRADIAQSQIFREGVNWEKEDLHDLMTTAILEDKMDFVRLLLNQGVSMKEYLTVTRLEHLYNKVDKLQIPKPNFLHEILNCHFHNSQEEELTLHNIKGFLDTLLDRYDDDRLEPGAELGQEESEQFKQPYKQLLIWAVLLNRPRLAQFFWEMGEEPIISALVCTQLCMGMNKLIPKFQSRVKEEFLTMKTKFEELAIKVLDECHATDPDKAVMLVERKSSAWSHLSCLQIAAAADDKAFMASTACQESINVTWRSGIVSNWRKMLLTTLFPVLILIMIDFDNRQLANGPWKKIATFFISPVTTFAYFTISYVSFLGLYSYMLLVDFQKYPSYLEYVLMIWIFSLFVGEVHALFAFPSATLTRKLDHWFTLPNSLELINMVLAFVSFGLRLNAVFFTEAKIIYCTNVVIFYISIIQLYIPNSHLGPKMYMIIKMVKQLVMFLVVLVVFLVAYGVASQGLLYHRRVESWDILRDVIYYPYFSLFGELFLDEYQTDKVCTALLSNGTELAPYDNTCQTFSWLVHILLGLYLLVGNILLLNLLIAIFSHVFETVEKNAIEIWKFQMYFLVMEFKTRVKLPPPLSLILHIYVLFRWLLRKVTCARKTKQDELYQKNQLQDLNLFEKATLANNLRCQKSESKDSDQVKITKLQKCVDMLSKQMEDRQIEDDSYRVSTLHEELKTRLPTEMSLDIKRATRPNTLKHRRCVESHSSADGSQLEDSCERQVDQRTLQGLRTGRSLSAPSDTHPYIPVPDDPVSFSDSEDA